MPKNLHTDVRSFWSALYESAYIDVDSKLDRSTLERLLMQTDSMFRYREHIATTEMPIEYLKGKSVLEIGCGAGSHSALFAYHGARMTSVDLSFQRAAATNHKFRLLEEKGEQCNALESDAECLPFLDNSFDIVYSNGVLHHSPDTNAAIAEAYRVLKPGGRAVIMLYCRSSINFWITMWFGYGILRGGLWRHGVERLGAQTEWAGTDAQKIENPITRSYTRDELRAMFSQFSDIKIRKSDFSIAHMPKIGKIYHRWLERRGRTHPGGLLPYGSPWPIASRFELWLGQYVGWGWNISAIKPIAAFHDDRHHRP